MINDFLKAKGMATLVVIGVIIIAVFLMFISGVDFFGRKTDQSKQQNTTLPEIVRLSPQEEIGLQTQVASIVKTKNLNRCQEIANEMYKAVCINNIALQLAVEKEDIGYCQKIDGKLVSRDSCERQVLFKKAQNQGDINVCSETKDAKLAKECQDGFWPSLALAKGDIKLCDNISADQAKQNCQDNYIFQKEFIISVKNFDCGKFSSDLAKADCQTYKNNLSKKQQETCKDYKSLLFLNVCTSRM